MKTSLITAALASSLASVGNEPPAEIVFLPEGEHQITATVDGAPKTITVKVPAFKGPEIAQRLQSSLAERHAGNVRPHLAFQHQVGAASGTPKAFRYEPGKGVMLAVDWSGSGAAAIRNKDFGYFSPVFLLDDDGTPGSLPTKGELGSLVNEPAFRSMPRIAAADAGAGVDRFYRDLAVSAGFGELTSEEDAKWALQEYGPDANKDAETREKAREAKAADDADKANEELQKRARQHVASGDAATFQDGLVMAAHADGELYRKATSGPVRKDTARELEKMRESHKGPSPWNELEELADSFIASGKTEDKKTARLMAYEKRPDLYQAWQDDQKEAHKQSDSSVKASDFEGKAKALVAAGQAKTLDEALGLVAASDPSAYTAYLSTLH
jgi:hypothetical protein